MFVNGNWKSVKTSGFLKKRYYKPKNIIFQHISVKENVFNDRKNRYEEINCFRNGDITQHLFGVYIEELVRSVGYIVKILGVFICDELEFNPFE